jgi:hypothetical protein
MNGAGGLVALIVEIVFLFVVILGTVLLVQGTRRVPVQYARRIVGNKQYGGVSQYIPLEGECCRCYANHIRPGNNDAAGYHCRISQSPDSGFVVAFTICTDSGITL